MKFLKVISLFFLAISLGVSAEVMFDTTKSNIEWIGKKVIGSSHNGDIKIKNLARAINLSERQLQRRFKKAVGLRPKEFAKIRKIRAAVIQLLLQKKDYQDVIYNTGYYDQAHFIHDFS